MQGSRDIRKPLSRRDFVRPRAAADSLANHCRKDAPDPPPRSTRLLPYMPVRAGHKAESMKTYSGPVETGIADNAESDWYPAKQSLSHRRRKTPDLSNLPVPAVPRVSAPHAPERRSILRRADPASTCRQAVPALPTCL